MTTNFKSYNEIDDAVKIHMIKTPLEFAVVSMNIDKVGGKQTVLDFNSGETVSFRRHKRFAPAITPLTEATSNIGGVADNFQKIEADDYQATVQEYGAWTQMSDKAKLLTTNDEFNATLEGMGLQIGETLEKLNHNALKACPHQFYANGATTLAGTSARLSIADIHKVCSFLESNKAEKITQVLGGNSDYGQTTIGASYVVLSDEALRYEWYSLDGFVRSYKYAKQEGVINQNEIGILDHARVLVSNSVYGPSKGVGDTVDATIANTNGKADLYPLVFLGKGAFNTIGLGNSKSIVVDVATPEVNASTPFGNVYTMSWRTWHAICLTGPDYLATLWVAKKA